MIVQSDLLESVRKQVAECPLHEEGAVFIWLAGQGIDHEEFEDFKWSLAEMLPGNTTDDEKELWAMGFSAGFASGWICKRDEVKA